MTEYTVADYLLDRLAEVGVRHLFGVPGDFTLAFLDHVERHPVIEWVGCANELGAGYAADGYARLGGFGALSTTFGVGELSAINAVAGSYAEHVPVLHVVGAPTTATQAAGRATHHSLGDGDFGHFARMSAEVTGAQAVLAAGGATADIDRVLTEIRDRRLPGYLVIPADVSESVVSPPAAPLPPVRWETAPDALRGFTAAVDGLLAAAQHIAVLADILVARVGAEAALRGLLDHGVPHATLLWGRRVVDESDPAYLGSYLGASSDERVRAAVEDSDVVVLAGVQFTDLTSGFFSQRIDVDRSIEIRGEHATVGGTRFAPIAMVDALAAVADCVTRAREHLHLIGSAADGPAAPRAHGATVTVALDAPATALDDVAVAASRDAMGASDRAGDASLDQAGLWQAVSAFLRPGDTVLADQGTSFYGMADHRLPHDTVFVGQPLWASIGYTLPALLGAALARPERRPVLLIGDGAAQLTVAELGTLIRRRIPAIIVLVDNGGYTVERAIHGLTEEYNDIAAWDWGALVAAMDPTRTATAARVLTRSSLEDALSAARGAETLTLIQAVVPPLDIPPVLITLAAAAAGANARRP